MARALRWAGAMLALLAAAGRVEAQNGVFVIGPGSTAQGDILRGQGAALSGQGAALLGLGMFNLYSAQAAAINTDTWMQLNEYLYQSRKNQEKVWNEKLQARMKYRNENLAKIRQRIRDNPNEADLLSTANALNVLVEELSDPKIHPSTLRYARVPLPGGALQSIPFHHPSTGGIFSLRRLKVDDSWPTVLNQKPFERERNAYLRAVDAVLEEDVRGELTQNSLDALVDACDDLQIKLERTVNQGDVKLYNSGRLFIQDLHRISESLRTDNFLQRLLAEMEKFPGTTVAELVEFMWRYNLQFFPAETTAERDLYKILYHALRQQRDLAMAQGAGPVGEPGVKAADAGDIFGPPIRP